MNGRTPGYPVLHCLPEFAQAHVCWVNDAIQPSHPLSSPSPPALNKVSLFLNEIPLTTHSVQFSSVTQSCPTLCDPMNHSTPGLPVHQQLSECTQTHVHRISDAIQPSHPLSSLSPPAPIPPSIRVFSNESTLHMRWPKYWSGVPLPSPNTSSSNLKKKHVFYISSQYSNGKMNPYW